MDKRHLSNSKDIKSVAQSISIALDSFMQKYPIKPNQIHQLTRDKIISYSSIIKGIISGCGDELWDTFEKDIDKQLDEVKKSNLNLKGKQAMLASSLVKIEKESNENRFQDSNEIDKSVLLKKIEAKDSAIDNINAEILQLEAENEALQAAPLPVIKPPSTAEKNARISLKQKQQEYSNLNNEYDKMRRDFSIQIQQNSQGLEKSKRDVERLEMQINAIQSRINLMNRASNIPKRSLQESSKIPKLSDFNRPNGSNLPTLSLSIHSNVISPDHTDESDQLPTVNNDFLMNGESNIPRKPSSQPQQSLKELAFNRYNRPVKISISDTENSQQQQQQKANRIQRTRISTTEMDKTDKCLQEMSAAFLEAEEFLKEINAFDENNDNQSSQNIGGKISENRNEINTDNIRENNDDIYATANNQIENENNEVKKDIKVIPKVVAEPKSSPSTPSHKRIPVMPKTPNNSSSPRNPRKKDDISFMPISEEEVKKVARPLTCNDSEKPRRIPVNLREGYELVFFHIAERVPKLV